jgi:probable phosphoglycerate mutase
MRLILVRHGDAHAGLHGVIAGPRGCSGLTDRGRQQADALRDWLATGEHLRIDTLVTSKLPRAIETANIIAPALGFAEVTQDCDLCEVHTGEADGLDWAEYSSRFGAVDMLGDHDVPFAPGGDSWAGFHDRVDAVMARLAGEHLASTVMAVCHAGVIAASVRVRLGAPLTGGARLTPTNTGLTEWEFGEDAERWTLRYYDRTDHLDPASPTRSVRH